MRSASCATIAANARLKAPGPGWSPGGAIWATAASPSCGGATDERRSPHQGPRCSRSPAQAAAATAGPGRTGVLGPLSGWAPPFPEVPELWFVAASAALHVRALRIAGLRLGAEQRQGGSEEHTSELQSLMRIPYAVFCLKQKKTKPND